MFASAARNSGGGAGFSFPDLPARPFRPPPARSLRDFLGRPIWGHCLTLHLPQAEIKSPPPWNSNKPCRSATSSNTPILFLPKKWRMTPLFSQHVNRCRTIPPSLTPLDRSTIKRMPISLPQNCSRRRARNYQRTRWCSITMAWPCIKTVTHH